VATHRWNAQWSIRTRLVLLLVVLSIPFMVYLALSTRRQAERERLDAGQRMLSFAHLIAARLDDRVGSIQQVLTVLSRSAGSRHGDTDSNNRLLRELAERMPPEINTVSVWTVDGWNIGALDPKGRLQDINISKRDFFVEASKHREMVIEGPIPAASNGELVALLAMSIRHGGPMEGVVVVSIRLKSLQALLASASVLPEGTVVTITDAGGVVISRSLDPERWIGRNLLVTGEGGLAGSLLRRDGVRDGPSAEGIERIAGFTMATKVPWLVYAGVPVDVAMAPVRARIGEGIALGGVMLLIGLALAAWVAEGISSPLRRLSEQAAAFERGDLAHRSHVDEGGEIGRLASTLDRATEALQQRTAALQTSEERLSLALDGSNLALFDWDIARDRLYHSAQAAGMRGYAAEELAQPSAALRRQVHPDDHAPMRSAIRQAITGNDGRYNAEFRACTAAGGWIWLRARGRVVERDARGRALRLAGTYVDVTERRSIEERLRFLAEYDLLTGLPNRGRFMDRLTKALGRARASGQPMALLFLDIDHFKAVNDTLGHEAGDGLLKAFAQTLQACMRPSDTVARLGGDEFTMLLESLSDAGEAKAMARMLLTAARREVAAHGRSVQVSTSIGIAMVAAGEQDAASVLRRADAALYEAKRAGRDCYACDAGACG
jgi:diguanylate cyclase (GGDEF)-like protein/PAS domain S-box-containing protein